MYPICWAPGCPDTPEPMLMPVPVLSHLQNLHLECPLGYFHEESDLGSDPSVLLPSTQMPQWTKTEGKPTSEATSDLLLHFFIHIAGSSSFEDVSHKHRWAYQWWNSTSDSLTDFFLFHKLTSTQREAAPHWVIAHKQRLGSCQILTWHGSLVWFYPPPKKKTRDKLRQESYFKEFYPSIRD